ncbi:hypothetical protein [Novosphingobium sp. Leaf2]|uniref:hypothetical protein n=1 Tax=Novosphingobium sp. Leaf2 TaxID=1735670 RepID=UPI0012E12A1C|nr:hypothetical protein [Novosphingobium sp. Leaf2]
MIRLPASLTTGPNRFREFDQLSDSMIEEWMHRKSSGSSASPSESAAGYLKRESYRIISHYISQGRTRIFEEVIRRDGRALTSRVRLDENPFHFGLLALFSDDEVMSKQDRSTFSSQMLYAYHHSIPPRLLVGFIYQAGAKGEIKRKLTEGCIEPGFENVYKPDVSNVIAD